MSKRKTAGARIARKWWDTPTIDIDDLGQMIDRAIRRAKAEAWDEGWWSSVRCRRGLGSDINPYRGRAKR